MGVWMKNETIELAGQTFESAAELKRRLNIKEALLNMWQHEGLNYVKIGTRRFFDRQTVDLFIMRRSGYQ